jgi:hypothetical protein
LSVSQLTSYYDLLFCTGVQLGAVWIPTPSPHNVSTMKVFQNRQLREVLDVRQYEKEEQILILKVPTVLLIRLW